jgi:hypothetical protein
MSWPTICGAITAERRLNCKPNQESVLNYLYQSAGVIDAEGRFRIDLSRQALAANSADENENSLQEFNGLGPPNTYTAYRLRWYAPAANVETFLGLASGTITPAAKHCDGLLPIGPAETPVVRVDGLNIALLNGAKVIPQSPVDWDYNGNTTNTPNLDINFNGTKTETSAQFNGVNDWDHIVAFQGFRQLASRRSLFGLSLGVASRDLLNKTEFGPGGEFDLGEFDLGEFDLGEFDLGEFDLGATSGEFDLGEFDLGEFDLGEFDLGEFDLGDKVTGDIDESIALAVGNAPSGLTLVSRTNQAVVVKWDPPAVGAYVQYTVYRSTVGVAGSLKSLTPVLTGTPPPTTFTDQTIKNNESYIYFVIAGFDYDGNPSTVETRSSPSNLITVPRN